MASDIVAAPALCKATICDYHQYHQYFRSKRATLAALSTCEPFRTDQGLVMTGLPPGAEVCGCVRDKDRE
jgi:hypothetical protein